MALKRRNAEASKDAAVRSCVSLFRYNLTNTLSGRVRQHPPQACCRGQVPAAGDEEAPRFFHAQVNLPSHRRIGWVTLRGWLAETKDMQVVSTGQESSPCKNRLRGVGVWSSLECPTISKRGAYKSVWEFSFFEQCSSTFHQKRSLKKLLQNFHVFKAFSGSMLLMIPTNWISFVLLFCPYLCLTCWNNVFKVCYSFCVSSGLDHVVTPDA